MTDTEWADVSEHNPVVNDSYPYRVLSIRSNDGTYWDKKFDQNYQWALSALNSGRLDCLIVYFVWWPNWQDGVAVLKQRVGTPPPRLVVMLDVESWGGRISGNQSAGINACREDLIGWLGGERRRVIGYANGNDFSTLWPDRGDCQVVLANYSANPDFPNKIAHQFSDAWPCSPFGVCDMNSADGYDIPALLSAFGLMEDPLSGVDVDRLNTAVNEILGLFRNGTTADGKPAWILDANDGAVLHSELDAAVAKIDALAAQVGQLADAVSKVAAPAAAVLTGQVVHAQIVGVTPASSGTFPAGQ